MLGLAAAGCGEPAARAVGEAAGSAAARAVEGSANRSWVKPRVDRRWRLYCERLVPLTDVAPHQRRNGSAHRQQAVPGLARESATWWCWWGSPELVAQAARTALRRMQEAGEGDVRCAIAIAITVGRDRETFTSPDQFLLCVTPEGLRHFSALELRVTCDDLELVAAFTRPPRRGLRSGGSHTVHMEDTPADESRRADALMIARRVAGALSRGYARYWAGCASTPQLRDEVGRPLPFRGSLVMTAVVVVGMLLGARLARILDDLPRMLLSSLATVGVLHGVECSIPCSWRESSFTSRWPRPAGRA